ncbi:MAG: hypothetical protein Q4P15_00015 [Propionibacteriaceae bacterium]|nr:hypothetical protein [Propionibacteriaceae bacterium]
MSDIPFQRPGSEAGAGTSPLTMDGRGAFRPEASGSPDSPPAPRQDRGAWLWMAIGGAGFVVGGLAAVVLTNLYFAKPAPLTIALDTFPEYILGLQRVDIQDRTGDTRPQLEAAVMDGLDDFRFAYGGDGAEVDYEGGLTLAIVNGHLTPGLPSGNRVGFDDGSPRLISFEANPVKCVFVPVVDLYESAVLATPSDLTASGLTDCVLVDPKRNLSLRLANHTDGFRGDAIQVANKFADVLERTHAGLVD